MPNGVLIEEVTRGSRAERQGFRHGDRILSINGHPTEDHLDCRFHAAMGDMDIAIGRGGERFSFSIPEGPQPLDGLRLEEIHPHTCGNKCIFCFVDQLPRGVRPSLLVKDEDYRLSFLHGNYITLTTIQDREIDRIVEQRLSPLYISIHATDEDVREKLLGRPMKRPLLRTLERLLDGGIELWGQIVLCPGLNDDSVLEETIEVLSGYHPRFRGIAVVPLGLSAHRTPDPRLKEITPAIAERTIEYLERRRADLMERIGTRFVFAADEFYLKVNLPLPPSGDYEDFEMLEDGIGMARDFIDRFNEESDSHEGVPLSMRDSVLVTGRLFEPVLAPLLDQLEKRHGLRLPLVGVRNRFLGESISVAGLLGGADIVHAIRNVATDAKIVIPGNTISRANGLLIDDYTPERIARESGAKTVLPVDGPEDLFRLMR